MPEYDKRVSVFVGEGLPVLMELACTQKEMHDVCFINVAYLYDSYYDAESYASIYRVCADLTKRDGTIVFVHYGDFEPIPGIDCITSSGRQIKHIYTRTEKHNAHQFFELLYSLSPSAPLEVLDVFMTSGHAAAASIANHDIYTGIYNTHCRYDGWVYETFKYKKCINMIKQSIVSDWKFYDWTDL